MSDITLKIDGGYFIYRVGAIIVNDGKVLMAKNESFPFYYSIGGRVDYNETSENAVLREVYEETSVKFEIDRLAFIHENFFVAEWLHYSPCHEIAFYYLMKENENVNNVVCKSIVLENIVPGGIKESIHWLPINDLDNYEFYPEFFKTELSCLSNGIVHYVTKNNKSKKMSV